MESSVSKIKTLDDLDTIVSKLKSEKKQVVYCQGVFDLLHPGHIQHFQTARNQGDVLIVTIPEDQYVKLGPGRPVFNQRLRAESLAALGCVDFVTINRKPSAVEMISRLKPDVYVRGSESGISETVRDDQRSAEEKAVLDSGGRIVETNGVTFSSTQLINNYFSVFSDEAQGFLNGFRNQYSACQIISSLQSVENLRVLIIGDAIIDEYHYAEAIGKPSKSACVSAKFLRAESYPGGSLSIANHVAGFCRDVHLITCLGRKDPREEFIVRNLKSNISEKFFYRSDVSTVVKRRFVNPFQLTKMFEICIFDDENLDDQAEQEVCSYLTGIIKDFDIVIAADFGHGFIGPRIVDVLSSKARFLAVNAQANSANLGFNVVTKYPRAEYVCIDEREIRLAEHSKHGPIKELTKNIADRLKCCNVSVTLGGEGSLIYKANNGFCKIPVFSNRVVDTVGAGDAFLAITSLCTAIKESIDVIGFIGNAAGAMAVRIVGNKESVEPESLFTFIQTLLK